MDENYSGEQEYKPKSSSQGLTWGDLFSVAVKHIWLPLIAAVIFGVLGGFIQEWFINRPSRRSLLGFTITFPGVDKGYYPDGSVFSYDRLISAEVLNEVYSENAQFSSINIDKVIDSDSVTIDRETKTVLENGEEKLAYTDGYTLIVNTSAFPSDKIALSFAKAVANYAVDYVNSCVKNNYYNTYLDMYDSADTLELKLEYLSSQQKYLLDQYDQFIAQYGEQCRVNDVTLTEYRQATAAVYTDKQKDDLSTELTENMYLLNSSNDVSIYRLKIQTLQEKLEDNEKMVESLTDALEELRKSAPSGTDFSNNSNETYYYDKIATLTEEHVSMEREIAYLNKRISAASQTSASANYLQKLDNIRTNLESQTFIFSKTVVQPLYADKSNVLFSSNGFIVKGITNFAAGVVIGVIVGVFVGGMVAILMYTPAYMKRKYSLK